MAFEIIDTRGSSSHFDLASDPIGTSNTSIPGSPNEIISAFHIDFFSSPDNSPLARLFVSVDGGTKFKTLRPGDSWIWTPKGERRQLILKGSVTGLEYELTMNFEEF